MVTTSSYTVSTARPISRRQLLTGAGALAASALLFKGLQSSSATNRVTGLRHLVWVWQFTNDAEPHLLGHTLRDHGLGILLKTHDGVEWMSTYDRSPFAVSGPAQVATLANYYEDAGVPFHAWHVVKGVDPVREARMSAEVLAAGARSLFIDLEPHSGFWRGTSADAVAFGRELRRLQPDAWVVLSVDPRPWVLAQIPVAEFAAFSNEFAPQQYWRTFNTEGNRRRYAESGFPVPPEGMSPQFLTWVSHQVLGHYGLPINPTGQGHVDNPAEWYGFIDHAYEWGARLVSVWRYGVANRHVFQILRERPPIQPVVAVQEPLVYVVQPGDTLGKIAAEHGTTVAAIAEANGITDVNFISIGQQLKIPGATVHVTAMQTTQAAPAAAPVAASGQTYTVQPGDTLSGIAARFGTTVSRLVQLNGLSDPNFIRIGQVLVIG